LPARPDIYEPTVDLSYDGEIQLPDRRPLEHGLITLPPTIVCLIPNMDFPVSTVSLPKPKKLILLSEIDCA